MIGGFTIRKGKSSLDHLQGFAVDRQGNEDQEHDALDQLLNLRLIAQDRQSAVQHSVHQGADDDIGKPHLRAAGDRQSAQHQGDQDLRFQLVSGCRGDRSDLDHVDKGRQAGQRAGADEGQELDPAGADAGKPGRRLA